MAMNRFDELVDEFIYKARAAADVAGRKTSEVVELGKLKYQAKQTTWEIEKTYSKLGAIVYESKKSNESFEDIIAVAVEEIDGLNAKLEELEAKIMGYKDNGYTRGEPVPPQEPEEAPAPEEDQE